MSLELLYIYDRIDLMRFATVLTYQETIAMTNEIFFYQPHRALIRQSICLGVHTVTSLYGQQIKTVSNG